MPRYSLLNQFSGKVVVIREGVVNVEVNVLLHNRATITATMSQPAFAQLDLHLNSPVTVLVKETSILLSSAKTAPDLSARNLLQGRVEAIRTGLVNTEVQMCIAENEYLTCILGNAELALLNCETEDELWAFIKASEVILAAG